MSDSGWNGAFGAPALVRRATPEEAVTTWRQLLSGAWVVLDRFDDGCGRRLVLARFEGRTERPWHRLSGRERSVVAAAANGCSNRAIAAMLGISVSTVAGHLRTARKKLGGPRRLDLVREWAAVGDEREPVR